MVYIVIRCTECLEFTFIRSNQKTFNCKKCGKKNQFEKIKKFANAKRASEYINDLKMLEIQIYIDWPPYGPFFQM